MIAWVIIGVASLGTSFGLGMLIERFRWNGLIRDGFLPKPGQWRRA